jgi:6-phosphogluconolactonase
MASLLASWLASLVLAACGGDAMQAHPDALGDTHAIDAAPARYVAYVSGYATDIARFGVARDTGALTPAATTAAFAGNPSFLAVDPAATHLYAVSESTSRVGAYSLDPASGGLAFIDDVASGGSGPAHVFVDRSGAWVMVANYGDGEVAVFAIQPGGGVAAAQQTLLAGANAHEIVTDPSNRYAFVPCLGSDWVAQYTFDAATGTLAPNAVPHLATAAGAGPRHLAFSPDGRFAYLVAEKTSTLTALSLDVTTGQLAALQTISTRQAGATGANTGAEVWVHPGGAFVYASNRGDNTIAIFMRDTSTGHVTLVANPDTMGTTPRDFTLDPDGRFLYVANQGSGTVVPFAIDGATGALAPAASPVAAPAPTFVGIVALP